ncbi:MAG: hypothetical protein GXP10_11620, partial [Gammaproteobacteria bacterium]|nr:hypothetical protein [Gammaproteobacteria bacterium]
GNEAISRGTVITALNNTPTQTLDAFEAILDTLADGDKVAMRYFSLSDPRREVESVITMDRDWFGVRRCTRDPHSGFWPCHDLAKGPQPTPQQPGTTSFAETDDLRGKTIMPSLVLVDFDMPYQIDGVRGTHYVGTGLVVDAQRGLVVVDRNTVPASIGDVNLIFAGSLEVPGKVVMIHPYHNLSLVSYDPKLIGDTPVRSATFTTAPLAPGDPIWLAGLKRNHQLAVQETTVASVDALSVPVPSVPWFRDFNIKLVSITNQLATIGGVLLDEEGRVAALWADFAFQNGKKIASVLRGIPTDLVMEFADVVKRGGPLSMRSLEAELYLTSLVDARRRGLPEQWLKKLAAHSPKRREVLSVTRLVAGTPASRLLRESDLLLAAGGVPISDFREVEKAAQAAVMKLTILRSGEVMDVDVPTVELSGRGTDRIVGWAGALMQRPPRALAAQRGFLDEGIYVAWTWWGSPANHFGLAGTLRIVEVDGVAVPDLDSFLKVVSGKADRESVRLKVIDLGGRDRVLTLKLDLHYWPMFELRRSADGWQRRDDFVPPMVH